MSSGFYQYTSFIVTGSIWNTCYLEYSHTLLVSASFTGITHYLYTIGFLVYLDNQSTLISTIRYVPEYVLHIPTTTTSTGTIYLAVVPWNACGMSNTSSPRDNLTRSG